MDEEPPPISPKRIVAVYAFLVGLILIIVTAINWQFTADDWHDYDHCKSLAAPYTGEMFGCMQTERTLRPARQTQR